MRIGSDEHKELFCRAFMDAHLPYDPKDLPWPELDPRSLEILRAVPVWNMALQVEVNAGAMLDTFAKSQPDPLIREALALQGYEEARHGRMLEELSSRYGLGAQKEPPSLAPTRQAFVTFGYNECLDSFFGFGVFKIARDVKFVPDALTSVFARVLVEEANHIVFFVNWISYERARRGFTSPWLQAVPTTIGYIRALRKTMGRAGQTNTADKGLTAVGDIFSGLTLQSFLQACLSENERYMAAFDPRLLRPRVIPALARFVLGVADFGASLGLGQARKDDVARS